MKRFFLSLFFLSCFFLTNTTWAQSGEQSSQAIITIKSFDENGEVTIKKKRLEKGQSADEYLQDLNLDDTKNVEVTISSTDQEKNSRENLFMFRHKDMSVKINGEEGWQEALIDMDFELDDLFELKSLHQNSHFENENTVLLGVYPQSGEEGVIVDGLVVGSGADKAGLKKNDIMTAIDGKQIRTTGDLHDVLGNYQPDDVIVINVLRDGQNLKTSVTLTEKTNRSFRKSERDPCEVFFGIYVGNHGAGQEGVGVSGIIAGNGWPAEEAGLQKGDRIIAIDGIPVGTHRELVVERNKHQPGEAFTFTYLRDGQTFTADAKFKACPGEEEVEETTPLQAEPEELEFTDNALELKAFNAYPNPTFGNLNVRFQGEAVPTLVRIVDATGKVVFEENINNFDGNYNREIDISSGALGTLILSVVQNGQSLAKPIILVTRA